MNRTLLFPTAIWSDKFEEIDNDEILKFIYQLKDLNRGTVIHQADGWRTNENHIIFDPILEPLRKRIQKNIDEIASQYQYTLPLVLETGWAYITNKGNWHAPHTHPEGTISCAYYLKVPKESNSAIVFDDPRPARTATESNFINGENIINHSRLIITPKESEFVAFPSWLSHYVSPSQSEEDRVMITLNYKLKENESN